MLGNGLVIDETEISTSLAPMPCNFLKVSNKFVKKLCAYYYIYTACFYHLQLQIPTPHSLLLYTQLSWVLTIITW